MPKGIIAGGRKKCAKLTTLGIIEQQDKYETKTWDIHLGY